MFQDIFRFQVYFQGVYGVNQSSGLRGLGL